MNKHENLRTTAADVGEKSILPHKTALIMNLLFLWHTPLIAEKIRRLSGLKDFHFHFMPLGDFAAVEKLIDISHFSVIFIEHGQALIESQPAMFAARFPLVPLIAIGTASQEHDLLASMSSVGYWDYLLSHSINASTLRKAILSNSKRVDIMEKARRSETQERKVMDYSNSLLARISHEVRTPMNAVIGMAEMLYDTSPDSKQRFYIETIRESGVHVLTLFNDLLDYSNIESNNIVIHNRPFNLHEFLSEVVLEVMEQARRKRLELLLEFEPSLPMLFLGDVLRLRQMVMHLMENALKFTLQGSVCLRARSSKKDQRHWLGIEVEDTGEGIKSGQIPSLFKPYIETINEKDAIKGIGLGLTICHRLVQKMGGKIEVESQIGKGSIFSLQIPYNPIKNTPAYPPNPELKGKKVLFLTQDSLLDPILKKYMAYNDVELDIRTVGQDLSGLAEWLPPYDLLITHLRTNIKIDLKLVDIVREQKPIPHLLIKDREKMSDKLIVIRKDTVIIPKPLYYKDLLDSIRATLDKQANRLNSTGQYLQPDEHMAEYHPLDILVADDNVINQRIIISLLNRYGYQVRVADNGKEAIESLERRTYDVVLMDIQMPVLGGIEATQTIRSKFSKKKQPFIVALTAGQQMSSKSDYLQKGFDDILVKPVQAKELTQLLLQVSRRDR